MNETSGIRELLKARAEVVAANWCDAVLATYPERTYAAWTRELDPFANPVGHSLRVGTRAILDAVLDGADEATMRTVVADVMRIRAVQQMSPSTAVGFVFQLKNVVRSELAGRTADPRLEAERTDLDRRIDEVALAAFDVFTEHRERVAELRIAELKKNIPWAAGRAGQAMVERELG
jgi:hypothetical protein